MPSIPKLTLPFGYQDWIFIGLVVLMLVWLAGFVALVSYVASEKGRSALAWGAAAVVFSPLVALVALAAIPDRGGPVVVKLEDSQEIADVPKFKWRKS